jgi:hypothetical protein
LFFEIVDPARIPTTKTANSRIITVKNLPFEKVCLFGVSMYLLEVFDCAELE